MAGERRPWRPALALLCAACWRQGAGLKAFLRQPSDLTSFEDSLLGPAPSTASVAPNVEASRDLDADDEPGNQQMRITEYWRNKDSEEVPTTATASRDPHADDERRDKQMHITDYFRNKDSEEVPRTATAAAASASSSAAASEHRGAQIEGKLKDHSSLGGAGEAAGGAASSGHAAEQVGGKLKDLFGMGAGEATSASSSSTASEQRGGHIKVDFKDLLGLGGTEEAASGGQSKGAQEQEEAAEMLQHLGLMKEAMGATKAQRKGSSHQESQELGSLKTHLGEMTRATRSLVKGFVNASSPGRALQDIAQRHRNEKERRRRLNLQRQLLRGTPLSHSEGEPTLRRMDDEDREDRPVSLLALRRGEDARAGEPEPAHDRFRASRERLLAKLRAAASVSTPAPVSAADRAEEEAAEEEEDDGLDENGHHKFGHGEILAKVLHRLQKGTRQVGESMSKDVTAALQNITDEEEREHGNPNFLVDPVGKVQVVSDKIHRLADFFSGGLRSMAHNASKSMGKSAGVQGLEGLFMDGIRIHQTPNTGA